MFNQQKYEIFEDCLNCCPEILAAIETVSDEKFQFGYLMDRQTIIENGAFQLWEEGGREDEILNALPTSHNPEDGAEIYWGNEAFAEFDEKEGKWIKK